MPTINDSANTNQKCQGRFNKRQSQHVCDQVHMSTWFPNKPRAFQIQFQPKGEDQIKLRDEIAIAKTKPKDVKKIAKIATAITKPKKMPNQ